MPPSDLPSHFPTFAKIRKWLAEDGGVSRRLLWSACCAVVLILIVAAVFLTLAWRSRQDDTKRAQAYESLRLAQAAESNIAHLDAAYRAYLLTKQPLYFQRFVRHRTRVHQHLTTLLPMLTESAARDQVRTLNAHFREWLDQSALPEISALQSGRERVGRPQASATADDLRASASALVRSRAAVVEQAAVASDRQRALQTVGLVLLGGLGVTFLILTSRASYRIFRDHLRKAESALAQTHSIIATTLDGVLIVDDQGCIQSMNPSAEKMFGQPVEKMLGQNISLLIPQRLFFHDVASVGRATLTVMGQRQGYYPFPIEISLSELKVSGRRQFCAIIRDVTERKRGEETLKHIGLGVTAATGEEFVRSLLKQLSKALDHDRAFLVELGSEGDPRTMLTVAEKGELRASEPFDLQNTACAEVLAKGYRAHLAGVRVEFPEDPLLAEAEAEGFLGIPLADHRGVAIGVIGILDRQPLSDTGISESTLRIFAARAAAEVERKRSEEALAAEKERLAVTLRSIGDGCLTIDNEGRVLTLNPIAERLTGWSQDAAANKPLAEVLQLLDERTRRPCQHALQRIATSGTPDGITLPAVLVARDGTERLAESSSAPIRDRNGRKLGVVIVLRDVTERQKAEEERQKAEKLESLGVVAGGIAHDFNNILTTILGNISLALASNPEEQVATRLATARKAIGRAQELAGQLLTFAKGGSPVKQPTSIAQLIHDTVSYTLRDSRTRCHFQLPDSVWPVDADPGQLAQVINNLAINAEQAMPTGGSLHLTAENLELHTDSTSLGLRAGKWVRFSMQDEGAGIPEQYLKKIFDPYFTTKPKSSGLGLATAYSIVKNHSGVILAESRAGHGSVFTVCLPASEKKVQALTVKDAPVPVGNGRVLVLDDEEAICMLVTCALEPLGYEVTETQDALTAIGKYQEAMNSGRKYDLVISDLTIPGGMGGQEAIQRLRALDPSVRAIVSSGYANDPVMSRYEDFGFSGMIAKPYEIDALGRKVAEVLAQAAKPGVIFHDFERRSA
jgi:PAS domain S-box-containing protein